MANNHPSVEETSRHFRPNNFNAVLRANRNPDVIQDEDAFGKSMASTAIARIGMMADQGTDPNIQYVVDGGLYKVRLTNLGGLRLGLGVKEGTSDGTDAKNMMKQLCHAMVTTGEYSGSFLDIEVRGPMVKPPGCGGNLAYTRDTVVLLYHPLLQPGGDYHIFKTRYVGVKKRVRRTFPGGGAYGGYTSTTINIGEGFEI